MAAEFQPAPTWAHPILESTDPATGERKATFNPVWLKWFVDLTSVVTSGGGGTGQLGNVVGPASATDGHMAVFDGTTGKKIKDGGAPGGGGVFADAVVPTGVINGSNVTFTLPQAPAPAASLFLYHAHGSPYIGGGVHYTLAGTTITFEVAAVPQTGDLLYANYRY